jgi:hypothetical protein
MWNEFRWLKIGSTLFTIMTHTPTYIIYTNHIVVTFRVAMMTRLCYSELRNCTTRVCLGQLRQYCDAVIVMLLWLRNALRTGGQAEYSSLESPTYR